MSIWHNTNGSDDIIRSRKNSISSIGIIGGSFYIKRDPVIEKKYRNWVEECANIMQPCSHSIEETKKYFLQQCEAVPIDSDDKRMISYQYSVVINYKLKNRLSEFSLDMNDEALDKWAKEQSDIRREIMNTMPEHYGLKTTGYYLPKTERNLYLYEEFRDEIKRLTKQKEDIDMHTFSQDMCFFFEETTEDIQCHNGGRSFMNKLFVFRGVSEEDIKLRNARFQGYLSSMRELGNIPDFR
jgi:hypothetical protein